MTILTEVTKELRAAKLAYDVARQAAITASIAKDAAKANWDAARKDFDAIVEKIKENAEKTDAN